MSSEGPPALFSLLQMSLSLTLLLGVFVVCGSYLAPKLTAIEYLAPKGVSAKVST